MTLPSQSMKNQHRPKTWNRFVDSASILTASIGIAFMLGWFRVEAFWDRIGYNHVSLSFPTTYYLVNGYLGLFFLPSIFFLFKMLRSPVFLRYGKTRMVVFIATGCLTGFVIALRSGAGMRQVIFGSVVAIVVFIFALLFDSLRDIDRRDPIILRAALFAILLGFAMYSSRSSGNREAENVLSGKRGENVILYGKEGLPSIIEGNQFTLVLHNEGKYYVIEQGVQPSIQPKVYIVPDDMVKLAVASPITPK